MLADGRTDVTKLMVAFHNFANASEKKKSLQKRRTRKQERKKKKVKKDGWMEGR
jgi:hypothetical protein